MNAMFMIRRVGFVHELNSTGKIVCIEHASGELRVSPLHLEAAWMCSYFGTFWMCYLIERVLAWSPSPAAGRHAPESIRGVMPYRSLRSPLL